MKRRTVLSSIGTGSFTGLAGCTSLFDEGGEVDGSHIELGYVEASNSSSESRTMDVRVARDDEVITTETYDLPPRDYDTLECTWPSEPGDFRVGGRLGDQEEWRVWDLTDDDSDCVSVTVFVHPNRDSLAISTRRDGDPDVDPCDCNVD